MFNTYRFINNLIDTESIKNIILATLSTSNINKTGRRTRHYHTISQWRNCKMLDRKGHGFKLLIFVSEKL